MIRPALALALLAALCRADGVADAADQVLEAHRARRELKDVAAKDEPDPWLVADALCARGEYDAAEAFAKAAPRTDTEKLPSYVASRRGRPQNAAAREALGALGRALSAKDPKAALAAMHGVENKGTNIVSVRLLHGRGLALRGVRRQQESATAFLRAAEAAERLGWLKGAVDALRQASMSAYYGSDWRGALAALRRCHAIEETRKNRAGVAKALNNIGIIYSLRGEYPKALEYYEQSLRLTEELGDRAGAANTLNNIGTIHMGRGKYPEALEYYERSLKLMEELGNQAGAAKALGNIGLIHENLGDYPKALEHHQRSLQIKEDLGDRAGVAATLVNMGIIHKNRGDYAKALQGCERGLKLAESIGHRRWAANALGNIGSIHEHLGDYPKALEYHRRALEITEELGDRAGVATTFVNMGIIHKNRGDNAKALEYQERALKISEELGDRAGVAITLGCIGVVHKVRGDYPKALENEQRALKLKEELRDRAGVAATLGNIGGIYERLADYPKALAFRERALRLAEELGALETVVLNLWGFTWVHLARGEPDRAVATAKRAVERMSLFAGGLAEEEGAFLRGRYASVFDLGARAAARLEDAADTVFFLESGRAGTLLESLGGRDKLRAASLPEDLLKEDAEAQAAEAVARKRYLRTLNLGKPEEIQRLRRDFDAAREARKAVIEKIQREEKAAANLLYPRADSLEEIQASLREGEALVLYALLPKEPLALVATTKEARIVRLVGPDDISAACGAIRVGVRSRATRGMVLKKEKATAGMPDAVTKLRQLVVEPLGLSQDVKRLLVSPHGALSYVPFALLAPDREVVHVPSGTTYRLLTGERKLRGKGVLGLGDPDYETKVDATAKAVYRAGGSEALAPLPGTRAEVQALADVKLLGKDATEGRLRETLRRPERWHAVHLACHGLVDPERPTLSSLALTADADHDGFLTALEVFRMKIPADLVVLSACETGRGKVVQGEGIVGMTRAFMFAGAPRVIVSLWKVDDEATRALMVKFYELWNPQDGSKGLPAATALKQAQAYIAGHEKWKHPYFWAAWQLWGLPD